MCVFLCVSVCFCVSVCVTVHEAWSCRRHFSCVSGFPITSSRFNPATSALSKDCGSENFSYLHIPPVARLAGWPPTIHSHLTLTLCSPLQPERRTPGPEHIQVAIHPLTSKSKEACSTFALFKIKRLLLTLIHVSQPKLGDISDLRLDIIIGQKCWLLSASFDSLKRIKWAGFHILGESVWKQRLQ